MNKEELLNRLIKLDEEVSMVLPSSEHINVTIVGGCALILQGYLNRSTLDIDLIDLYLPTLYPIMEKYDVNCRSNAFSDCLAENYFDRLKKVDLNTKAIDFYTLSLEDLVIMKLFSDREKDLLDITEKEVLENIDWKALSKIIESGEVDVSFNQAKYKRFLEKYYSYVKEYQK